MVMNRNVITSFKSKYIVRPKWVAVETCKTKQLTPFVYNTVEQ